MGQQGRGQPEALLLFYFCSYLESEIQESILCHIYKLEESWYLFNVLVKVVRGWQWLWHLQTLDKRGDNFQLCSYASGCNFSCKRWHLRRVTVRACCPLPSGLQTLTKPLNGSSHFKLTFLSRLSCQQMASLHKPGQTNVIWFKLYKSVQPCLFLRYEIQ